MTSAAMSGFVLGRPGHRFCERSYLWQPDAGTSRRGYPIWSVTRARWLAFIAVLLSRSDRPLGGIGADWRQIVATSHWCRTLSQQEFVLDHPFQGPLLF